MVMIMMMIMMIMVIMVMKVMLRKVPKATPDGLQAILRMIDDFACHPDHWIRLPFSKDKPTLLLLEMVSVVLEVLLLVVLQKLPGTR